MCVCIYIHSGKLPWLWKKDYEKIVWWTLHRERLTEVRSLARKKWGIDDLLPRNNGEWYGIMMFYGDLHMKRFDWIYESSSWVFRADWKQNKWKSNHEKLAELVMISSFWGNSTSLAMENGVFGPPIDGHEMMANVRLQTIGFWGRGGSIFVINSVDQCTFTSKDRTCIYQG